MSRTTKQPQSTPTRSGVSGPEACDVLTLTEAAAYLRLPESAVQVAVEEQDLPGRFINGEWRFLRAGIQDWLRSGPKPKANKEAWRALAGAWKDDPNLEELLKEIDSQRRRWQSEGER